MNTDTQKEREEIIWDVLLKRKRVVESDVTLTMDNAFKNCTAFSGSISSWDTSQMTNIADMLKECKGND